MDESRQVRHGQPLSERAFPLIANRLTRPGSEHAPGAVVGRLLCDQSGGEPLASPMEAHRQVKVRFEQLRLWYQTLDDRSTPAV